jgi:hypothetical protein
VTVRHTRAAPTDWLTVTRRYLVAVTVGNLVWETAQMPLYTLWWTGTAREIAQAVLHCASGDIVIATVALILALALVGSPVWPDRRAGAVIAVVAIGAVGYTIYSEYVNTVLQRSWSYTAWMPRLPRLGTGLSPLAQWLIIPPAALLWSARALPSR